MYIDGGEEASTTTKVTVSYSNGKITFFGSYDGNTYEVGISIPTKGGKPGNQTGDVSNGESHGC